MPVANVLGVPHTYELTPAELTSTTPQSTALVFIHGWLLSRHYWRPMIQALSAEYTCLAYDLRGFGDSTQQLDRRGQTCLLTSMGQPPEATADISPSSPQQNSQQVVQFAPLSASSYSLMAYAEDLVSLLQTLKCDRVWLVGHSLGGSVALWAAHLAPKLVQGVICMNAGGGVYIQKAFDQFRTAGQQMVQVRPHWLRHLPLLPRIFANIMVAHSLQLRWGQQRLYDFLRADAQAARESLLASTTETEVHRLPYLVSQLKQPAYFITGSNDQVMEPRYVRHLASFHRLFRQGQPNVIELAQCGHFAMLEQTPQVAKTVQEILEKSE
ncbi:MAG: alpha/beta hydrolase [Cyanobacteria bacterium P01_G01_bin.38]